MGHFFSYAAVAPTRSIASKHEDRPIRKKPHKGNSTARVLAFLQHHIAIHRAALSIGGKTRNFSRLVPFARSGNKRINFKLFEIMAIAPQTGFILPPKEVIACFKLRRIEPSRSEPALRLRIPRFGLFHKLLVAHELPKRRAYNTTRRCLLKKRIDKPHAKLERRNVMEEPKASDQIARFSIDCMRQTHADRKLANDVKILETSREALVFGQMRNKSRAVIDSEVVDLATAKFFAKKRGETHIAARYIEYANGSTLSDCPRLCGCAVI